jgi:WD40 repeat protein
MSSRSIPAAKVGQGRFTYAVDPSWSEIPTEWPIPDVSGVGVDDQDRVYVLSPNQQTVFIYSRDRHPIGAWKVPAPDGAVVPDGKSFVSLGADDRAPRYVYPHTLTIGPASTVFVTDNQDNTVRLFSVEGELLMTIGASGVASDTGSSSDFRTVVRSAGPFNGPAKVAVAPSGDLYVADGYRNARIHCFTSEGQLKFSWGEPGEGKGQFRVPHSLAITDQDEVAVADRENNRVVFFDLHGTYIREWANLSRPVDIAIDREGNFYILELGLYATVWGFLPKYDPSKPCSRISIFTKEGDLLARWGTRDASTLGSFYTPHAIALDSGGDIYVGETNWVIEQGRGEGPSGGRTLQKFRRQNIV